MHNINQLIFFIFFSSIFFSCKGQLNTNGSCEKKFKEARDLAYKNYTRQSALDSALILTNECMQCNSIRQAVVDLKIRLLITMEKYSEGMNFVDSLKEDDFMFKFKKKINYNNFRALLYTSQNDTINRNLVYREMANYLERYIKEEHVEGKEFEEIYNDLFTVQEFYLDTDQINKEIENLKKLYPEKEPFFDFFKK